MSEGKRIIIVSDDNEADIVREAVKRNNLNVDDFEILVDPEARASAAERAELKEGFKSSLNFYGTYLKNSTHMAMLQNNVYPVIEAYKEILDKAPYLKEILMIPQENPLKSKKTNICGECRNNGVYKVISRTRLFCYAHYVEFLRENGIGATSISTPESASVN